MFDLNPIGYVLKCKLGYFIITYSIFYFTGRRIQYLRGLNAIFLFNIKFNQGAKFMNKKFMFFSLMFLFIIFLVGCGFHPSTTITTDLNPSKTIYFEENGGTTVSDITALVGTQVEEPQDPTKARYIFAGWYSDSELSLPYTFTTMPANDITLYAKWSSGFYTLSYVDHDGTVLKTQDFEFGADLSSVIPPIDPTRI